jgi:protoporphyrinogen oxidase
MRIAIIGAGISGLYTAFYLQRERPEVDTTHSCGSYFP